MVYTPPEYITATDLQVRAGGAAKLAQYCDDDGDSQADAIVLTTVIREASALADAYLLDAFGITAIGQLAQDEMFKGAVADIGLSIIGERRSEFGGGSGAERLATNRGQYPWAERRKRGETTLDRLGKAWMRSGVEKDIGDNRCLLRPIVDSLPSDGWEI